MVHKLIPLKNLIENIYPPTEEPWQENVPLYHHVYNDFRPETRIINTTVCDRYACVPGNIKKPKAHLYRQNESKIYF